jgi:hypothetical protein
MAYRPRPGSTADLALSYLATLTPGSTRTLAEIGQAIEMPPRSILSTLEYSIFHRLIIKHEGKPALWSIGDAYFDTLDLPPEDIIDPPQIRRIVNAALEPPPKTTGVRSIFDLAGAL